MFTVTTNPSMARRVYLPPECFVVDISTETPILQFSTKDWEEKPGEI